MAGNNIGKITQIISAVLDIKFQEGHLPEINEAIEVPLKDGGRLVVEVAQHLGDDTVRCIALGPTDGLVRGMDAIATGAPRADRSACRSERIRSDACSTFWVIRSMRSTRRRMSSTGRSTDRHHHSRSRQLHRRCLRPVSKS